MKKSGVCKLQGILHSYGSVMELSEKEGEAYVIPGSISLEFDGQPLRYTQVDSHGNPQIGGVADLILIWKIRQMVRDGKLDSQYSATAKYSYETTSSPIGIPVSQRLPQPDICPVCGRPITVTDLDNGVPITEDFGNGITSTSYHPRVETICDGRVVAHEPCAREFYRLQMIDKIADNVVAAFNSYDVDKENRFYWGHDERGIWYELIPNEYCPRECCAHRPWFLFHTPIGDIKIGWRKRVISITFMENFRDFDFEKLFKKEKVTQYTEDGQRTIHAWGYEKLFEYLSQVHKTVCPKRKKA